MTSPASPLTHSVAGPALPLLDDVQLYVNLGDSLGAGAYVRPPHSYAGLVLANDDLAYPAYRGEHVRARWPRARAVQNARSGATAREVVSAALADMPSWPATTGKGDVLVTVSMGGNDFNDSVATMLFPAATKAKGDEVGREYDRLLAGLGKRYEDPSAGRRVVLVGFTVHDSTDGTGRVPPGYTSGFCKTVQKWSFAGPTGAANLLAFNDAIRDALQRNKAYVADNHLWFKGHGLNAASPWIRGDCAHPNELGHHEIRRNVWKVVTGIAR